MASLIDQAKQIPASTIAEKDGVILKRHGARYWARCPFHKDKNPSMCFYPNGSWYCFSCKSGGDSVALHARIMNMSQYDAAKEICDQYHPISTTPIPRNAYAWKDKQVKALQKTIKQADEYTGQYSVENADQAWSDPVFMAAIRAKVQANGEIDDLYEADKEELKWLMTRGCGNNGRNQEL